MKLDLDWEKNLGQVGNFSEIFVQFSIWAKILRVIQGGRKVKNRL